jgi:hypothetical protein
MWIHFQRTLEGFELQKPLFFSPISKILQPLSSIRILLSKFETLQVPSNTMICSHEHTFGTREVLFFKPYIVK